MPGILNGRKRPSDTISDDGSQSESSYASVGSKRVRHARDASDNPASTNDARQEPNSQQGDNDYGGDVHQPGSIVRVKLTNFVTYTAAEFNLGPSLNMIIGPNGTGKSTLVCAICLGLGWSPLHLGRAKELGEFVKHGQAEATIEIELAGHLNEQSNPLIRRVIKKEGNKSAFFINKRGAPQKDVIALAKSYSIQIDNLCQFLPQDRVVEFAKLNAVSLLRETQRAAAPEHMVQWHDDLKRLRTEEKGLQVLQQNEDHHLKSLQTKQNATREDVQRWEQRQELVLKSRALEKCRPIISATILKAQVKTIQSDIAKSSEELKHYKAEIEPARRAQVEMGAYRQQVEQVAKVRRARFEAGKTSVDKLVSKIDAEQQALGGFTAEIDAEKQADKQRRQDVKRIEGDITRLTRARDDNVVEYDQSSFEARKAEIRSVRSAAERRAVELTAEYRSLHGEGIKKGEELRKKNEERALLDTQTGQQANLLQKLSSDTARGWEWLEANMDTLGLTDRIYPPPILCCSVSDPRYADAVESQLRPRSDLIAITCTKDRDQKIISRKLLGRRDEGGLGLHQITIRTAPKPRDFYTPPASEHELKRLGFDCFLIDCIKGPDPVLSMLCDSARLHRAAFARSRISKEQYSALERSQISTWVSGTEICKRITRREYGVSSTSVTQLKPAQFFTDQPIDTAEKQELDRAIVETERDLQQLKTLHREVGDQIREIKQEIGQADDQRGTVQAEQDNMKKAHAEWQRLPQKIAIKEGELADIRQRSADTHDRISASEAQIEKGSLKLAARTLDYAKAVTQLRTLHESYIEADIRMIEAKSEEAGYSADNAEIDRALQQKQAQVKELESQRQIEAARYKHLRVEAQRIIDTLTDSEREIVKEHRDLPTTDALENEIAATGSRLDMMAEGNPNAIKAYEKREQEVQTLQDKLETIVDQLQTAQEQIKQVREQWEPQLDELVSKISDGFSHNFSQIGCAGQVGVYKDEDFENWSIQIQVRFREGESLSVLDSHRQSGGERAVSTIFYLMALQDLARSPFRVVDEINQGMDPRNERMVHERMVDIACRERTSQYFLITPKLLNDLKFHPKMKVHCIASGEHMPDQNTNLDFQKLAQIALRVRKGVGVAA